MYDLCHLRFSSWDEKSPTNCCFSFLSVLLLLFFWFPYYSIVMINFISKFLVEVILFCIFLKFRLQEVWVFFIISNLVL